MVLKPKRLQHFDLACQRSSEGVNVNLTLFSGEADKPLVEPHAACFNCAW